MSYRYGGQIDKKKLEKRVRLLVSIGLLCGVVFSGPPKSYAWIKLYYYFMPSADTGGSDFNDFDAVNRSLTERIEPGLDPDIFPAPDERAKFGKDDYMTTRGFKDNDPNKTFSWDSYYWDDEDGWVHYNNFSIQPNQSQSITVERPGNALNPAGYTETITQAGRLVVTPIKFGQGDWDDFAMYSKMVNHVIPIRDEEARERLHHINDTQLKKEIFPLIKSIENTGTERHNENVNKGNLKYEAQRVLSSLSKYKSIFNRFKNPQNLFNGFKQYIMNTAKTSVNPENRGLVGFNRERGYNMDDIRAGSDGVIGQNKRKFVQNTYKEVETAYDKKQGDIKKIEEDINKLSEADTSAGTPEVESPSSAKEREEKLQRAKMELKKQKDEAEMVAARAEETRIVAKATDKILDDRNVKDQVHMPTAEEITNEVKEKKEKYSTSRDLGWRQFGKSNKKADFSKIFKHALDPKYRATEAEKQAKQESTNQDKNGGSNSDKDKEKTNS